MSAYRFDRTIQPSVLDRLIDDPDAPEPQTWEQSAAALRRAVLRDLEWLLNARRVYPPAPAALDLVCESIYHFGLRDLASRSAHAVDVRAQLRREIEEAIVTFEPRLSRVRVTMLPPAPGDSGPRLQIEAQLRLDTAPEPVMFETVVNAATSTIAVREPTDA
jgi:type VI secretion system protein ImpF